MSYGIFASVYDILTENVDYCRIASRICSLLSLNGVDGGLLLDLGCGTGTLSFLLEEKGFEVIGADPSEYMLSVANEKKYEKGSSALFLCQSGEALDLYGTVDCAVCSLDAVNHIDSLDKIRETFRRISLFMNRGGIFIFDINTPYKHKEVLGNNTFVYDTDEVYCVWQNTLENDSRTLIDLDFFIRDEKEEIYERYSESFYEYIYSPDDILNILKENGFTVLGCYDDYSDNSVTEKTERITVAVRKD